MKDNICSSCQTNPIKGHKNAKWCEPCSIERRKYPVSTMSKTQIAEAEKLIGSMPREMIAAALDVSLSNLKRAFSGRRLGYYNYCVANPKFVKEVNTYFESHTQEETANHFNLSKKQVDHIIYRYRSAEWKQIPWKDWQLIELVKMAGLISPTAQANFFNRPGAHEGSIKSAWSKKFNLAGGCINGLPQFRAKHFVNCKARYIRPLGMDRSGKKCEFRKLILWVDLENTLKKSCPSFIIEAVNAMASFQRWIWESNDPKPLILKMIKEREYTKEGF
jgi:hypothetical protein